MINVKRNVSLSQFIIVFKKKHQQRNPLAVVGDHQLNEVPVELEKNAESITCCQRWNILFPKAEDQDHTQ